MRRGGCAARHDDERENSREDNERLLRRQALGLERAAFCGGQAGGFFFWDTASRFILALYHALTSVSSRWRININICTFAASACNCPNKQHVHVDDETRSHFDAYF